MCSIMDFHQKKQRSTKSDLNKMSVKRSQLEAEYLKRLNIPQYDGESTVLEKPTEKGDKVEEGKNYMEEEDDEDESWKVVRTRRKSREEFKTWRQERNMIDHIEDGEEYLQKMW